MNEVEKMMQNANIEKKEKGYCDCDYMNCPYPEIDPCGKECPYWVDKGIDYPPFTAEKQIKIIEWLGNSKAFFVANETISSLITNHKDKNGVVKCYEGKGNSVDSCLASLINNLWQDLTEEERKQIKEILE